MGSYFMGLVCYFHINLVKGIYTESEIDLHKVSGSILFFKVFDPKN